MSETDLLRDLRIADDLVVRELDGEAIILHLTRGTYFGLDEIGTRVWRHLDRQDSLETAVSALVSEYAVDAETARSDVHRLVTQLLVHGLVVPNAADRSVPAGDRGPSAESKA